MITWSSCIVFSVFESLHTHDMLLVHWQRPCNLMRQRWGQIMLNYFPYACSSTYSSESSRIFSALVLRIIPCSHSTLWILPLVSLLCAKLDIPFLQFTHPLLLLFMSTKSDVFVSSVMYFAVGTFLLLKFHLISLAFQLNDVSWKNWWCLSFDQKYCNRDFWSLFGLASK